MKFVLMLALFLAAPDLQGQITSGGSGPIYSLPTTDYGAVAPWPAAGTGTTIAACGGTLARGTSYYLTQSIGADATAVCLTVGAGSGQTKLDIVSYTVTGTINGTGIDGNNLEIFSSANGLVECNVDSVTSGGGCIVVSSANAFTAASRIHHLRVNNLNDPGAGSVRAIQLDWTGAGGTSTAMEVDHITATVNTAATSTRSIAINATHSGTKVNIHHNDLTCSASAATCNLIQGIPTTVVAVNSAYHHNRFTLNSTDNLATGIALSGPDTGTDGPTGFDVYSNIIIAKNNKAFRIRQVKSVRVYDNLILDCQNSTTGCFYMADPQDAANAILNLDVRVFSNTIFMAGGTAFWQRNQQGITYKLNRIFGTSGKLTDFVLPLVGNTPTDATISDNANSLGTASTVATGASATVCNSGTFGGAGTITTVSPPCS